MTLRMADSAESQALNGLAVEAFAAYVDGGIGDQPNAARVAAAFPGARHLSIALSAAHDADCLDVENGAASPADVPGWVARQRARGIARPCLYANVSTMADAVLPAVRPVLRAGLASVRLWSAHYDPAHGEHICGPASCKWPGLTVAMDATQWTDAYHGPAGVVDMSLLADDFFGTPAPPATVNWTETAVKALPLIAQGSTDTQAVRTVQGLLCARGHAVTVDGNFGPATLTALRDFQRMRGITADGIAGPQAWPALLGVA
jgi:hypothetical protein